MWSEDSRHCIIATITTKVIHIHVQHSEQDDHKVSILRHNLTYWYRIGKGEGNTSLRRENNKQTNKKPEYSWHETWPHFSLGFSPYLILMSTTIDQCRNFGLSSIWSLSTDKHTPDNFTKKNNPILISSNGAWSLLINVDPALIQ